MRALVLALATILSAPAASAAQDGMSESPDYELVGSIAGGGGGTDVALLKVVATKRTVLVREGQTLDPATGVRVQSIEPDRVVLDRGGARIAVVRASFPDSGGSGGGGGDYGSMPSFASEPAPYEAPPLVDEAPPMVDEVPPAPETWAGEPGPAGGDGYGTLPPTNWLPPPPPPPDFNGIPED